MRLAIAAALLVTLEPYAERGAIMVPEARGGAGGGAQRRVSFVRLRSTAEKPAAPIVFLMGGPGIPGNVMLRVPPYYDLFNKLTAVLTARKQTRTTSTISAPRSACRRYAALAAVQRHGDHLERVVLASVNAPDAGLKRPALWDLQLRRAAPWIWSELPALFISGGLDANTPAAEAEEVRFGFPRGKHLIVDDGWHETLPLPAVQDAVVDFFRR